MGQRETGYYWIRLDQGWEPSRWDADRDAWSLIGSDITLPDDDVAAIGPVVQPPDGLEP